jgi:hypothetical protein
MRSFPAARDVRRWCVQLSSLIPRLLSILAVVSLLTTPMMTPSGAAATDVTSAADMSDMATMADGMPCCPHEKPVLPDCAKSCPWAILCLAQCFPNAPASAFLLVRFAVADVKTPDNDIWRNLLPDRPPLKPPRT